MLNAPGVGVGEGIGRKKEKGPEESLCRQFYAIDNKFCGRCKKTMQRGHNTRG